MIGFRALLLASTLALTGCSLAPKTVLPAPIKVILAIFGILSTISR